MGGGENQSAFTSNWKESGIPPYNWSLKYCAEGITKASAMLISCKKSPATAYNGISQQDTFM